MSVDVEEDCLADDFPLWHREMAAVLAEMLLRARRGVPSMLSLTPVWQRDVFNTRKLVQLTLEHIATDDFMHVHGDDLRASMGGVQRLTVLWRLAGTHYTLACANAQFVESKHLDIVLPVEKEVFMQFRTCALHGAGDAPPPVPADDDDDGGQPFSFTAAVDMVG
jgi:hypothetical protein